MRIDPFRYEIFSHRLFNVLEEGRIAIKMVSGSPVVVEGGETMCAFYTSDGIPILAAAGVLLHCTGAWDFIRKCIEWYEESPGIRDGDQFFFNDPYVGGQHLPDMVIIKPIFYNGERIAWTGSIMHTPETGGIEPGGMPPSSTEIFQEGIRIPGLKIVEGGEFRQDVFNTIVQQVRDPHMVGLDTKAKIAANNVCAKSYLQLVDKFGLEFVRAASLKMVADSEAMSRSKLARLPDGIWRSRHYGDSNGISEHLFKVECKMTKEGDSITFDFTGSSPQNAGSANSTLPGTWGSLFVPLASQLLWDVPWNGGMFAPVKLIAPPGTVVNCSFPAACATGVNTIGTIISQAAHECMAKMLYASGVYEDVSSGWATGGCPYFGGKNWNGNACAGVILDAFASGCGATPVRDGVHTGGHMMNPTSSISDVEIIEMNLPFMYLVRRQCPDSGGFGKFAGGMGGEVIYMVYGTEDLRIGRICVTGSVLPSHGIFGGHPPGLMDGIFVIDSDLAAQMAGGRYPTGVQELLSLNGEMRFVSSSSAPIALKQFDALGSYWSGGGGYGDPLDREPDLVRSDVECGVISPETAEHVYGVVIRGEPLKVDSQRTDEAREAIRKGRLREAVGISTTDTGAK